MSAPTRRPPVELPRGEARDALVRALAALLLDEERRDAARDALRRMRP